MQQNIILAGVGGQGILTIAKAISSAALGRGLNVKQAEVHGMSQRGGAVQSHLRISDRDLYSDTVPIGKADMIIAVEPLEALRYVRFLNSTGVLIASVDPMVNIQQYPAVEEVLMAIAEYPRHIMVDALRIARAAGSARAANMVMLAAAAEYLELQWDDLVAAVDAMFSAKGERVVRSNRRAMTLGRAAALAYRDATQCGVPSPVVRAHLETMTADDLAGGVATDWTQITAAALQPRLSGPEVRAVEASLQEAYDEGRTQLFEHEVYAIVQLVGAITPPRHIFVPAQDLISAEALDEFSGEQVVLKIVSPDIVHKSDAGGVRFVPKRYDEVRKAIDGLIAKHSERSEVRGVLVVEHVETASSGFGSELFVGIRATREFGPVIAAGLGGVDTEYLAATMQPGLAVAKAVVADVTAERFLDAFRLTTAYEVLTGKVRGHRPVVSDGELLRCFRAFIYLAERFCVDRGEQGPDVAELEVNPFAFQRNRMVPLDGRGRLAPAAKAPPARPIAHIGRLLEPSSIAVLGVSADERSFGRIILNNILACGFPRGQLTAIKPGASSIDGVDCVGSVSELPRVVDLLVVAAGARVLDDVVREILESRKVRSVILIPGGVGETEGSADLLVRVRQRIAAARAERGGNETPVFLGPNSLGIVSRRGRYDTFFIPDDKLDKRRGEAPCPVALISQSGAFIISRLSNLDTLSPAIAISIGNQLDLTLSDVVGAVGVRDDIETVGIYAEGFSDLDGQALLRTITDLKENGKEVVFYKAGRTESGRSAAAGHTASVAGDYDICRTGAGQAGAMVAETFKSFEQLVSLSAALHGKTVRGGRIATLANAGFEAVGVADTANETVGEIKMSTLSDQTCERLRTMLADASLAHLVNARNPLDITPMATEEVYERGLRILLEADEVDAVIVGIVPLTPALATTADELKTSGGSLVARLAAEISKHDKPVVLVVDCGAAYEPLVAALRQAGLCVMRSADQAARMLARYLLHRLQRG